MDFLEKLDFMMKKHSLNKNTLSKACNIPYTTIDNWYKRGYEGLKLATVRKIASFFDTTLDYWFLDEVTDENYGKSSGFEISYDEMKHIKKYRALDAYGQETVSIILNREAKRMELKEDHTDLTIVQQDIRTMQYYQRIASAGSGEYLFDDIPTDTITVENTPVSDEADFVIGVNGQSMEPTYYDGELVFVKKASSIPVGEIGIFTKGNECFIKELGKDRLISHNADKVRYPDILPDGEIRLVGAVLGKAEKA